MNQLLLQPNDPPEVHHPPVPSSSSESSSGSSTISSRLSSVYSPQHFHSVSTLSDIYPLASPPSLASTSLSSIDPSSPYSNSLHTHHHNHAQSPAVSQLMALFQQPTPTTQQGEINTLQVPAVDDNAKATGLRKRRSKVKLTSQRSKRQFRPTNHQSSSTLDLLDNHQLTTFPQVYNTFVGIAGQVELSSTPYFPPKQHLTHQSLLSKEDSIVFVEDYFDATVPTQSQHPHTHRVVKSTSSVHSLSPFSTMRRGSLVKACVHCKKQLLEFMNTSFSELVCNDCACLQQKINPKLFKHNKFSSISTSTLPIIHSTSPNGWYSTVRRKLRWRWRFKGLLPPGVAN